MNEKKFVFVFLTSFLVVITSVAVFNYKVDSYCLFSRSYLLENSLDDLLSGRMVSGISDVDRNVKKLIIEKMQNIPDTIVLGSSRSFLLRASFLGHEKTGSFFNHSVGGGSLKDYIAILGTYKRKGELPETIIIEVAPWLFDERSETSLFMRQWEPVAHAYYDFMNLLDYNTPRLISLYKNVQYEISRTAELIAYFYTIENMKSFLSGAEKNYRIVNCNYSDVLVKMPDGSQSFPFRKRSQYGKKKVSYKNLKQHVSKQYLRKIFFELIDYLDKNGTQVVFFLPPYNPKAYQVIKKASELRYILDYEQMIWDLAKAKKIPVIGSYNPHSSHLSYRDFSDTQHLNSDHAMEKVFNNYLNITGKKTIAEKDSNPGIAHLASADLEYHWLEAEYADSIDYPLEVVDDANASEGKFMFSPNGTGTASPQSIMATYTVTISQPGEYILWGRVRGSDALDNSFFVEIDYGYDNLWEVELGENWHWDAVNYRGRADPVEFILFEGKHTIKVKLREDGTKLDKLLLTNNLNFVPSGEGDIAENKSSPEDSTGS